MEVSTDSVKFVLLSSIVVLVIAVAVAVVVWVAVPVAVAVVVAVVLIVVDELERVRGGIFADDNKGKAGGVYVTPVSTGDDITGEVDPEES